MITGAEIILDSFSTHGISRIFVYPGGTIAPILDVALSRGVEIVTPRHEQGAGYAALAAAKLTGHPQVVLVTSGPGVTNLVTVVADAFFDSVPLVVLTGQVGLADMRGERPVRQRGFQEVDTCALMRPVSKAQFLVRETAQLPEIMASAFHLAAEGRPGPVIIDLPMPVQRMTVEAATGVPEAQKVPVRAVASVDLEGVEKLLGWLREARRPVIVSGQGVLLSGASEALREFVKMTSIPVSQSLLGLGAFPTDSPLALGFHGHTGNQTAGLAIHHADLLLVLGSRLDVRQTGTQVSEFAPGGRIVRVDLDVTELEHSRVRHDLVIRGDVGGVLDCLNENLVGQSLPSFGEWLEQIRAWKERFPLEYVRSGPLKPQHVIEAVNRLTTGRRVFCVSGVGSHQQWAARHFDFNHPARRWLTSGGHGAMGYDLPVAFGAQLQDPAALVICFVGDGSLQMNIQELASIVERGLPVKIFVLNNHRLGIVSQFQKLNWRTDPTCGGKWNPDFAAIARAYGMTGLSLSDWSGVEETLRQALEQDGPVLVNCVVDGDEDVSPMLLGGSTMDKMWPYHG
jgi:acetolactate synthase-1/2/3 large subunit